MTAKTRQNRFQEEASALLDELAEMTENGEPSKSYLLDELQAAFGMDRTEATEVYDDWRGITLSTNTRTEEATCGDIEKDYTELCSQGICQKDALLHLSKKYGFTTHEVSYMVQ